MIWHTAHDAGRSNQRPHTTAITLPTFQVAEDFALPAATASFSLRFTAPLLAAEHFWLLVPRCGTACYRRLRRHLLWRPSALDSRRSCWLNHILTFGWSDIVCLYSIYSGPNSVLNTNNSWLIDWMINAICCCSNTTQTASTDLTKQLINWLMVRACWFRERCSRDETIIHYCDVARTHWQWINHAWKTGQSAPRYRESHQATGISLGSLYENIYSPEYTVAYRNKQNLTNLATTK